MHFWPHAPARRTHEGGAVFVTACTVDKAPFFKGEERLALLQSTLFELAHERNLGLEAWAIFPDHYHLVVRADPGFDLADLFKRLLGRTALAVNRLDGVWGRKVWFNDRDTALTNPRSYLARLHYTHTNPVKHGLAARNYPFCSVHWFETQADMAFVNTVYSFPIDRLVIDDDF